MGISLYFLYVSPRVYFSQVVAYLILPFLLVQSVFLVLKTANYDFAKALISFSYLQVSMRTKLSGIGPIHNVYGNRRKSRGRKFQYWTGYAGKPCPWAIIGRIMSDNKLPS